jgi:uncharacterized protein (TIGR00251 family)
MITIKTTSDGLTFSVYVQPRASKVSVGGTHADALKVRLTAPPAGGAANKQCLRILAEALDLPKTSLTITAGQTSRSKQIRIKLLHGPLTPDQTQALQARLESLGQKIG